MRMMSVGVRVPPITRFALWFWAVCHCLVTHGTRSQKASSPWNIRATGKERPYLIRTTDNSLFRLGRVVQLRRNGFQRLPRHLIQNWASIVYWLQYSINRPKCKDKFEKPGEISENGKQVSGINFVSIPETCFLFTASVWWFAHTAERTFPG